ncbi:MAG: NAD(P)-dependent oxidoreductase [Rhizobiaceae bacterium]|nr:NAD(P)-dependent oxidoreductase [Rhizobiaceae bacterium]
MNAVGFVGLGNIGAPIANCIAKAGARLHVYDISPTPDRVPQDAISEASPRALGANTEIVFLCLPSAEAGHSFAAEVATLESRPKIVVDTSTIGPSGAASLSRALAASGIAYIDAPVSGGVARAVRADLTSMVAGDPAAVEAAAPWIRAYSSKIVNMGAKPGLAQAMKLVNNYASVACMLSTSEAISYGLRQGLGMDAMLEVMNTSSGQSFVSSVLFPKHIANGAFDSAAPARIVAKDLALFLREADLAGTSHTIGDEALSLFTGYSPENPEEDWLHIFEFIRDRGNRPG